MRLMETFELSSLCPFCEIIMPRRCRHCHSCKRCVERFDHHCPWINNCVGRDNFGYFYFHVLFVFLYVSCSFVASILCTYFHVHDIYSCLVLFRCIEHICALKLALCSQTRERFWIHHLPSWSTWGFGARKDRFCNEYNQSYPLLGIYYEFFVS